MSKWIVSGLASLVLGSGCGVHAQIKEQSPIETIVITNETIRQRKQKKADDFCYVANALRSRGSIDPAIEYYKKALKQNFKHAEASNNIAECYLLKKEFGLAEFYAKNAVKNAPNNPFYRATLEMIEREKKKRRAVITNFI